MMIIEIWGFIGSFLLQFRQKLEMRKTSNVQQKVTLS